MSNVFEGQRFDDDVLGKCACSFFHGALGLQPAPTLSLPCLAFAFIKLVIEVMVYKGPNEVDTIWKC